MKKLGGFLLILLLLTACNRAYNPVSEDLRTQSAAFDGAWKGHFQMRHFQKHNRYEYTCGDYQVNLLLNVQQGAIYGAVEIHNSSKASFVAYLNDQGYFFGSIPTEARYGNDGSRPMINLLFTGTLDSASNQGVGRMIIAEGHDHYGCSADFTVKRAI